MFLQEQTWLMDIIRMLFASIDYVVFSLIKWVLYLIFDISQLSASNTVLNQIYHRMYVVLAIFMAFKLSFSFFQYVVNPDAMVDKKQGFGKLLQNVIIMLAALIALPRILFGYGVKEQGLLIRAQNAFLPMVPRIILGINSTNGEGKTTYTNDDTIGTAAEQMAGQLMIAFFTPKRDDLMEKCKDSDNDIKNIEELPSIELLTSLVNTSCETNESRMKIGPFTITTARYYYYSYTFIASTICGVIILAILIGMLLDVSKRVFKMIILQVIAPIPIMSLIDPDSYQKGAFGAWMHQLINTYIEIFLKIGVLYIVIMLIQLITTKELFGSKENFPTFAEQPIRSALLIVALVIGLFQFAREAPKFIKDALGIKEKGDGGGNMGKIARVAGGTVSGAAGGAVHGDMVSGAVQGGQAASKAKPGESAHAFRAGSDRAAQLRTGDDKYKTGFGASMQRRVGAHAGYSTTGYQNMQNKAKQDKNAADLAEKNASDKQFEAAQADQIASRYRSQADSANRQANEAQALYDDFKKNGHKDFGKWVSKQSSAVQQKLASNGITNAGQLDNYVTTKKNAATRAQTSYTASQQSATAKHTAAKAAQDTARTARKTADASTKKAETYKSEMSRFGVASRAEGGIAGFGYKARTSKVADTARSYGNRAVEAIEDNRVVGGVARSIHSAHEQGILNDIARGTRADNVMSDGSGGFVDESVMRTNSRQELDAQGTIQSFNREFMDALGGSGPHDGHYGPGGPADGSHDAATGGTRHGRGA